MTEEKKSIVKKLFDIQTKLKAPKGQYNPFGKYNYRSSEDILEAVKPLLNDAIVTIADSIELIGERYYVKATAKFMDETGSIDAIAFAREPAMQKGMAEPQITGSASSYARKYALNGLLCIDDSKDDDNKNSGSDATNTTTGNTTCNYDSMANHQNKDHKKPPGDWIDPEKYVDDMAKDQNTPQCCGRAMIIAKFDTKDCKKGDTYCPQCKKIN